MAIHEALHKSHVDSNNIHKCLQRIRGMVDKKKPVLQWT